MNTVPTKESVSDYIRRSFRMHQGKPGPLLIVTLVIVALVLIALGLTLFTFLIQWLWGWIVPDLFPALVKDGSLTGTISGWTAFKILVALILITSLFGGRSTRLQNMSRSKKTSTAQELAVVETDAEETAAPTANPHVFPALVDPLTDRELEVLQLLAKGLTNAQIAMQLDLSESTVVYHIGHIFGKLRVSSRIEAAVWAKERGII